MARKKKHLVTVAIASFAIAVLFRISPWFILSDPYKKEDYVTNSGPLQNENDQELCQFTNCTNTKIIEYDFTSLAPQVNGSIPQEVAGNIKHFLFFVGTTRSGTSFVQRLLNSHPHAIVSDGMGIFETLAMHKDLNSRKKIAEEIFKFVCSTKLVRHQNGLVKGYLFSWKDKITLLGDKKPPAESKWIFGHFDRFRKLYLKLSKIFGSVKILSMVRDPYEVVLKSVLADMVAKEGLKNAPDGTVPYDQVLEIDSTTGLYQIPESLLMAKTIKTSKQVNVTVEIMNKPVYDMKLYQQDDFLENGRKYLYELCDWLDLECFENFVDYVIESQLQKSRSRKHSFLWTDTIKSAINQLIKKYPTYYLDGEKYIM